MRPVLLDLKPSPRMTGYSKSYNFLQNFVDNEHLTYDHILHIRSLYNSESIHRTLCSCAFLCRKKKKSTPFYTFHAPQGNTIRQDESHVEKRCCDRVN
jgi:hypothetical protein